MFWTLIKAEVGDKTHILMILFTILCSHAQTGQENKPAVNKLFLMSPLDILIITTLSVVLLNFSTLSAAPVIHQAAYSMISSVILVFFLLNYLFQIFQEWVGDISTEDKNTEKEIMKMKKEHKTRIQ